jgi:chromosome segregation ATPase
MLRKNSMTSYAIIVLLASFLISPVNTIAQTNDNKFASKVQIEKKPVPQKGLSSSLELSKKIAALEEELSRTKTALFAKQQAGNEMYNEINMLTTSMKGLQAVVNKKHTELVALKNAYETYNDVITCYRTALSAWDNQLRARARTGPDLITIGTELRSAISKCPSI